MPCPALSKLFTAIALAVDSIRVHKLRSFLTLLGVIMGVASVILVGAAIDGLGAYAENITSKAFGTNSFLVAQIAAVGRLTSKDLARKQKYNHRIGPGDLKYLREATGEDVLYSPYQQRVEDVKAENLTYESANIIGVSYNMPEIRDVPVEEGRFFTEAEEQRHRTVAVIGQDIREQILSGRIAHRPGDQDHWRGLHCGRLTRAPRVFFRPEPRQSGVHPEHSLSGYVYGTKQHGVVWKSSARHRAEYERRARCDARGFAQPLPRCPRQGR